MATKKSSSKKSKSVVKSGILLQSNRPILSYAALVFMMLFAGFGGYILHGFTFAANSPELRLDLGNQKSCVDDTGGRPGREVKGGANPVTLYTCTGGSPQHFTGYGNQIRWNGQAQCLDVKGAGTANGSPVDLYPCLGGHSNQEWSFSTSGAIVGVGSGKCLDDSGSSQSNGNKLEIWACNGGANQHWTFTYFGTTSSSGLNCYGDPGINNHGSAYKYPGECQSAVNWMNHYGYNNNQGQLTCISNIYDEESSWNKYAQNPSGAYGIPQALPGSKMSSAGSNWQSSADTQIHWGIGYMKAIYGSPCQAWKFHLANGYY